MPCRTEVAMPEYEKLLDKTTALQKEVQRLQETERGLFYEILELKAWVRRLEAGYE